MKKLSVEQEQSIFQTAYGRNISVRTWYRYRKLLLENSITISPENLVLLAKFKKSMKQANDSESFLVFLTFTQKLKKKSELFTGENFLKMLENHFKISFHHSTVSGWFRNFGGFGKNKVYETDHLISISLKAFLLAKKVYK